MHRLRASYVGLAAVLVAFALSTAACGGASGSGSGGGAAGLAPGSVLGFATIDTDFASSQITGAKAVLDKFPFGAKLLAELEKSLGSAGPDVAKLKSAIGPELDIAVLTVDGKPAVVGFTKPKDVAAFESTLKSGSSPSKYETIDGWTAFSDSQAALDAVTNRTSNLSDAAGYQDGRKSLPADALATAYIDHSAFALAGTSLSGVVAGAGAAGGALDASKIDWVTAALTSHDNGFGLELHVHSGAPAPSAASSSLEDEIPGGALLAASGDLSSLEKTVLSQAGGTAAGALAPVQSALGVSLQDLLKALAGPAILYVKPGAPLPEVTMAVKPADAQQAQQVVASLVAKLTKGAAPTSVKVGDVTLQKVSLGPVSLLYGVVDGQLVITDSETAVGELRSTSNRLADDDAFKAAKQASGLPDTNGGFVYVDLQDGIPAVEGLGALAQMTVPASVDANLKPLKSLVVYGSRDGQTQSFVIFLQTI